MGSWSFETIDTARDDSPFELDGIIHGGQLVPGPIGQALELNGIDEFVEVPGATSILQNVSKGSISLWFRVNDIPINDEAIVPIFYYGSKDACTSVFDASNRGFIIEVGHNPFHRRSKKLYYTAFANQCSFPSLCWNTSADIQVGKWYHLVIQITDFSNGGYLNGEPLTNRRFNFGYELDHDFFSDARAHEVLWFGKGYWNSKPHFMDGALDDIRIYNRNLTPANITALYKQGNVATNSHLPNQSSASAYYLANKSAIIVEQNASNTYYLYDSQGKLLKAKGINGNKGSISTEQFEKGIYFLVSYGKNPLSQKLLIN